MLPLGTVTFLLTDVEGSTLGWQTNGPVMGAAIARHYEILDAAVAAHGGVRPQEQGEGDSVVAAFGRASDALLAAIDAQRALALEPWSGLLAGPVRVRMAIHTGEAQMRDEANYVGQAIIRTARLRAIAHGGQVLVSQAARDLAVDQWGGRLELVDLGVHRLKDLARPEHVWQLAADGLGREFPPLKSLDAVPNNLPMELSSFVGRESEIATVVGLVERNRLVVVNGAGGAGKTRLAQQVAALLSDRFVDGVWWVELASLDPGSVLSMVASVVSVTDPARLAERLAGRSVLLVLDNCEHVLDVVAPLVHAIHVRCPNVYVLATSRGSLDVPGEVTWRVPPLSLPLPGVVVPVDRLGQFDAVRLFVERACRARPNFVLTNANGPVVAELCARLDAIPLAIELAAARAKSLTPEQILSGLEDSLRLLTGGSRVVLPRQQTLEASIDWSHNLLGGKERVLLRRLSVFSGGCDLVAAEGVCADRDLLGEMDVLDALERLIDQSLVNVNETGGTARYQLLETVRQYAARQLIEAGETDPLAERHTQWYTKLAAEVGPLAEGPFEAKCIATLLPERENIAAVMTRLRDMGLAERLADLVLALAACWDHSDQNLTGSDWTTVVLDLLGPTPSVLRGRLLGARAKHHSLAARMDRTMESAQEATVIAERFGDHETIGRARCQLANATRFFDPAAALRLYEQASADCRAVGDLYGETMAEVNRNWGNFLTGNMVGMREGLRRSEGLVSQLSNPAMTNTWLAFHISTCLASGDHEATRSGLDRLTYKPGLQPPPLLVNLLARADITLQTETGLTGGNLEELYEQVRRMERSDHQMFAFMLRGLIARVHHIRDEFPEVMQLTDATLAAAVASGPMMVRTIIDMHFVGVQAALALGDLGDAKRRLGLAASFVGPGASRLLVGEFHVTRALVGRADGDLVGAESDVHLALSVAAEQGMMREVLLCFELLAGLAACHGSWAEAARLAGAAEQQREDRKLGLRVEPHRSQHAADLGAARVALGGGVFDAAFDEGRRLSLDDVVAFAQRTRGERGRPTIGWLSLTPTERRVADLARAGLSNAGIAKELLMGAETVKTHLSRIYAKVGVANRTRLAALTPPPVD